MITAKLGDPLIHLPSVDSTNNYAISLLKQPDTREGTVILADFQTGGRGQSGNQWVSDKASNLLFSVILKPRTVPAEKQFYLSMCISIGIAEFLSLLTGPVAIKWPNDMLVNNKKIAGMLIENTIMGEYLNSSVIGIGLNVNQRGFPSSLQQATSLSIQSGISYDLRSLLDSLLKCLSDSVTQLYNGRLAIIKTNYLNNLNGLNRWLNFSDDTGNFEGRITDVADTGELIIMRRDGTIRWYAFKEIRFSGDF
jgi:BirA family biotin operon repressor/biotin-[acetyl-CoA-carboxylase] ligase